MKKVLLFLSVLILSIGLSKASSFKLDAASMETKFAAAQEISVDQINFNSLTQNATVADGKSRVVAGLLAICLGGFGAHRFYLGHTTAGLVYCAGTVLVGLSYIVGWVDGIMYLVATDEEFASKYANNDKIFQWL